MRLDIHSPRGKHPGLFIQFTTTNPVGRGTGITAIRTRHVNHRVGGREIVIPDINVVIQPVAAEWSGAQGQPGRVRVKRTRVPGINNRAASVPERIPGHAPIIGPFTVGSIRIAKPEPEPG